MNLNTGFHQKIFATASFALLITVLVSQPVMAQEQSGIQFHRVQDLLLLSQEWGNQSTDPFFVSDLNQDGKVNQLDLLILVYSFSLPTPTPTPTLPEATSTPTTLPTATSTPTPTPTPPPEDTPTPTTIPEGTSTPTPTLPLEATSTPTPLPEGTSTPTPTLPPEGTSTPTPTIPLEATSTPTPLPEVTSTPTPTLPLEATSTPTPLPEVTPTPTPTLPLEATSTPTPLPEGTSTPTPTPTLPPEATSTPTIPPAATSTPTLQIPPIDTATPIPTIPIEITPTPTPTLPPEDTPTPTNTPTNTPTVPIDITPTPTPEPIGFVEFFLDFDELESLPGGGIVTLDANAKTELVAQGRMSDSNEVIPWFLFDVEGDYPAGVALSDPISAAINTNFGIYSNSQTSVLEIKSAFNTSQATTPRIEFDVAFSFEDSGTENRINDFLVVEVLQAGQTEYELLDLNGDGEIITSRTAVGEVLSAGTFDGFFDNSNVSGDYDSLQKEDFIHVVANLPKSQSLSIAFRFESDSSIPFYEGAYLDNVHVYDAIGSVTGETAITGIVNRDGDSFYVDTETRARIQGENLVPVQSVIYTSRDGETALAFNEEEESIFVVIPRLATPLESDDATIKVVRADGMTSEPFTITLQEAPAPEISTISPSTIFVDAADATISIMGNHFRPAFEGAASEDGSVVIFHQDGMEDFIPDEFISRSLTGIVVDGSPLKNFLLGSVEVSVQNLYSGQISNSVVLNLEAGSGELEVDLFEIEVGGFGGHVYDPASEIFPLQNDHAFSLFWEGIGFITSSLNVDVAGRPFVINGEPVVTDDIPAGKIDIIVDQYSASLSISPMVVNVIGDVTASIRVANSDPIVNTFSIQTPLPPVLYYRDDDYYIGGDWSTESLSLSVSQTILIYGDNLRGLGTGVTDPETFSQVFLLPVTEDGTLDTENPVDLPLILDSFDVNVQPLISDNPSGEDILFQTIPSNGSVLPGTYGIRVLNPDSGLYVDSGLDEDGNLLTIVLTE